MIWQVLAAFTVSSSVCLLILKAGGRYIPLDRPNHRSMHVDPVPRGGGVGILLGVAAGSLIVGVPFVSQGAGLAILGSLLLAIVAWWDDHKDISPVYRLAIQVMAACCLLIAVFYQLPGSANPLALWWMLLLLFILLPIVVWSINLYNFMDGMDGLATAMAIVGFGCLAWFGWRAGEGGYASMALCVVAACAGFLPFNLHPARMFMGDVGSTLLGFWAAGLSLWGIALELYPWWVPLLVFSVFWVDATVTLLRRIWKREKIFQAHKSHVYQRLVGSGLGQHRTLLLEIVLMMTCALIAVRIVQTS
jgi:UDP-N-acetylmuramyl pentapeptide phosphotransferase/UDP-N-acetylglucosamine-1-phosphate transferase